MTKIVGINRNAMAPNPGSRVKFLEPERLAAGALYHVPDVDIERPRELGHLVHERNVDVPVRVFEQFRHLCFAGAFSPDDSLYEPTIELCCTLGTGRRYSAYDLWRVCNSIQGITRINPLWRECETKIDSSEQARSLKDRLHHF